MPGERVLFSSDCVVAGYLPNLAGHGAPLQGAAVAAGIDRVRRVLERAIETGRPPTGPRAA